MTHVDVAIVGAGPAGLSAAAGIAELTPRYLIIDAGSALAARDRHDADDLTAGVGGAGLFSDGKFSFFPAATHLWQLEGRAELARAYAATAALLERHGLGCPPFPAGGGDGDGEAADERWSHKPYPSHYLPLDRRLALTRELFRPSADPARHRLGTRVVEVSATAGREAAEHPHALLLEDVATGARTEVRARHVVLAGGRFHPLSLRPAAVPLVFRRFEYGVRLEDVASSPFFTALRGVDPKHRFARAARAVEWRTFCCCRDGEVVASNTAELFSASGRADGPPTGLSNLGFQARVRDAAVGDRIARVVLASARRERTLFRMGLGALLRSGDASPKGLVLRARFGAEGAALLVEGLELLGREHPALLASPTATLIGPTIEGVGRYPDHDGNLRIPGTTIWIAGDCGGRFRGLVASLVSGRYVAERIRRHPGG